LVQDVYVEKIITKYRLINQPKPKTFIISDAMLLYEQQASDYEILLYQQKVGFIIYAIFIIRPDAIRASQKLIKFLQNLSLKYYIIINRIIVYLYYTRTYALIYGFTNGALIFQSVSNAIYIDDFIIRRSIKGYYVHLFGSLID